MHSKHYKSLNLKKLVLFVYHFKFLRKTVFYLSCKIWFLHIWDFDFHVYGNLMNRSRFTKIDNFAFTILGSITKFWQNIHFHRLIRDSLSGANTGGVLHPPGSCFPCFFSTCMSRGWENWNSPKKVVHTASFRRFLRILGPFLEKDRNPKTLVLKKDFRPKEVMTFCKTLQY